MLPVDVYARLYDLARQSRGGTFVEIGTAHGAATIALARGAQDGGQPFHVHTVDPFGGALSSRSAYGTVEENVEIVRSNYVHFGVDLDITITVGTVDTLLKKRSLETITLLMLDADGRIDRDLAALEGHLSHRCPIIIDDIDGQLYIGSINGRRVLDQKHRIGHLLSEAFEAAGILERQWEIAGTGLFVKRPSSAAAILAVALPAYRELVFADLGDARRAGDPAWRRFVRDHVPFARDVYRRLRPPRAKGD